MTAERGAQVHGPPLVVKDSVVHHRKLDVECAGRSEKSRINFLDRAIETPARVFSLEAERIAGVPVIHLAILGPYDGTEEGLVTCIGGEAFPRCFFAGQFNCHRAVCMGLGSEIQPREDVCVQHPPVHHLNIGRHKMRPIAGLNALRMSRCAPFEKVGDVTTFEILKRDPGTM